MQPDPVPRSARRRGEAVGLACFRLLHMLERQLHQQLRFRAGDEGIRRDGKVPSEKFLLTQDMGQRLPGAAPGNSPFQPGGRFRSKGTGPGQDDAGAVKAGDGLHQGADADMRAVVARGAEAGGGLLHERIQCGEGRREHGGARAESGGGGGLPRMCGIIPFQGPCGGTFFSPLARPCPFSCRRRRGEPCLWRRGRP